MIETLQLLKPFLLCFTAIFVAMDPMGNVPIFLGLSENMGPTERTRVVRTSVITAFFVALVFLALGISIFDFLGISLSDFKIAGGIVLLLVSLSDLLRGPESVKEGSGSTGIVPLAVPLITGPGVITTILLQQPLAGYGLTFLAMILNFGITWVVLQNAQKIRSLIGKDGTVVLSKIAALLLSAIAVSMIRSGVLETIRQAMESR